jgi:AAHS family 4-hydroxybenzoate transporter-like MFS transporter
LRSLAALSRAHLFVLAVAILLQVIDGFDLLSMSLVASSVAAEWRMSPAELGLIFSAAQFGALLAAALVVPLANRFGRRQLLIASTILVGLGSLASAMATNGVELLIFRVLTGMGLGVIAPMIVGYSSEFIPLRVRGLATGLILSALFLGYIVGGLLAALVIPTLGWRAMFVIGAVTPLAMAPFMFALPPSLVELRRRGRPESEIAAICDRYAVPLPRIVAKKARGAWRLPLRDLFATGRGRPLMADAVAMTCCGLIVFFLISWLPSLTRDAGLSIRFSLIASSILSLGALLGNAFVGWAMDRWSPYTVLGLMLMGGSAALALLPAVPGEPETVLPVCLLVGFFAMGSVPGAITFCSIVFPNDLRMEAIATMTVLSRLGGLIAPASAGLVLAAGGTGTQLFLLASAVAGLGAVTMLVSGSVGRTRGEQFRAED